MFAIEPVRIGQIQQGCIGRCDIGIFGANTKTFDDTFDNSTSIWLVSRLIIETFSVTRLNPSFFEPDFGPMEMSFVGASFAMMMMFPQIESEQSQ
jgi:hypothetical protein